MEDDVAEVHLFEGFAEAMATIGVSELVGAITTAAIVIASRTSDKKPQDILREAAETCPWDDEEWLVIKKRFTDRYPQTEFVI